jgi:hypothetical protein
MTELNRQQICAELGVSESTIRRLEQLGLPFTPVGKRSKRNDLAGCKAWLRANYGEHGAIPAPTGPAVWKPSDEYMKAVAKVKLRTKPS